MSADNSSVLLESPVMYTQHTNC